jgi:hypothetical protein
VTERVMHYGGESSPSFDPGNSSVMRRQVPGHRQSLVVYNFYYVTTLNTYFKGSTINANNLIITRLTSV